MKLINKFIRQSASNIINTFAKVMDQNECNFSFTRLFQDDESVGSRVMPKKQLEIRARQC